MGLGGLAGRVLGDLQVGTTDADIGNDGARGVVAWAWLGGLASVMGDVLSWDNPAMTGRTMGLCEVGGDLLLDGRVSVLQRCTVHRRR